MALSVDDERLTSFRDMHDTPLQKLMDETLLHYLGNVEGKKLMDVGCGVGRFCRIVKSKGASYVLGIDIQPELIHIAQELDEGANRCDFRVGNAKTMGKIDDFDFVTSESLLHFTKTDSQLGIMVSNFYVNVKPGGISAHIGLNMFEDEHMDELTTHYGLGRVELLTPINNVKRLLYRAENKPSSGFDSQVILYYFDAAVYRAIFLQAGFLKLEFKPIVVTGDLSSNFIEGYWDKYMSKPGHLCYFAEK